MHLDRLCPYCKTRPEYENSGTMLLMCDGGCLSTCLGKDEDELLDEVEKQIRLEISWNNLVSWRLKQDKRKKLKRKQVLEGKKKLRLHQLRERNRSIVHEKKSQADSLSCECCGFCFESFYGQIGAGYCEVHHVSPLSDREVECQTSVDDLAIVCANCHRMLHRRGLISIDDLREIVTAKRLLVTTKRWVEAQP